MYMYVLILYMYNNKVFSFLIINLFSLFLLQYTGSSYQMRKIPAKCCTDLVFN